MPTKPSWRQSMRSPTRVRMARRLRRSSGKRARRGSPAPDIRRRECATAASTRCRPRCARTRPASGTSLAGTLGHREVHVDGRHFLIGQDCAVHPRPPRGPWAVCATARDGSRGAHRGRARGRRRPRARRDRMLVLALPRGAGGLRRDPARGAALTEGQRAPSRGCRRRRRGSTPRYPSPRGSSRSRSQSPVRLNPSTVAAISAPASIARRGVRSRCAVP